MARSTSRTQYESYFAVKRGENGITYRLDGDKAALLSWAKVPFGTGEPEGDILPDTPQDQSENPDFSEEMRRFMSNFAQTMDAFRALSSVTKGIREPLRLAIAEAQLEKYAKEKCDIIKEVDGCGVYGVPPGHTSVLVKSVQRFKEFETGLEMLPGSIILSLTAVFDSHMAEFIGRVLKENPDRFDGKSVSVKDIMSMSSLADVIDRVVDDEIDSLMRKSHADQVIYVEEKFSVKIRDGYSRWPSYVEFFERRNLIAHGKSVINKHYIKNCTENRFSVTADKLGSKIGLTQKYMSKSMDMLTEFGLLMMFTIWRKIRPNESADAFSAVNAIAYRLLTLKRPRLASEILSYVTGIKDPVVPEPMRKMIAVNLANAYRKIDEIEKSETELKRFDWESSADKFKICVAAIRGEKDAVLALMPRIREEVSSDEIREWPAFDTLRDDKDFAAEFQKLFGEPLLGGVAGMTTSRASDSA